MVWKQRAIRNPLANILKFIYEKLILITSLSVCSMSVYAQINDSLRRVVKMEGAFNFRDAGGYKTTDGKEVVWGRFTAVMQLINCRIVI